MGVARADNSVKIDEIWRCIGDQEFCSTLLYSQVLDDPISTQ